MASYGQLIDKTSIGSAIAYQGGGDTSTSYWTFVFANSCWFRGYAGTASNIYQPHPTVVTEFWRYSISQQQWIKVASHSNGKDTSTAYRVRCPYNPNVQSISPSLRAEYNGKEIIFPDFRDRSYLDQARRQAKWLANWLTSAIGEFVGVSPVVSIPGWFIEQKAKPGGVYVVNPRQLKNVIRSKSNPYIDPKKIQQINHQLEAKCRDIAIKSKQYDK